MRIAIAIAVAAGMFWLVMHFFPRNDQSAPLSGTPTAADQSYHGQIFDYVMEIVDAGKPYRWKTSSVRGTITADARYKSKSGAICRTFREDIELVSARGSQEGIACRRQGRDGWCRLNSDNAQTCAMESASYHFNIGGFNFGNGIHIGKLNVEAPDLNVGIPPVNVGSVEAPDAPKTDGITDWFPKQPERKGSGWAVDWMTR